MGKQDVLKRVEEIVDSYDCRREALIAIMQDIQNEYKYLSTEALELVASKLGVGVAKVYSVATFYENFSLEAKGKYISRPQIPAHLRRAAGVSGAQRQAEDLVRRALYARDRGMSRRVRALAGHDRQRRGAPQDDAGERHRAAGKSARKGGGKPCRSVS